MSTDIGTLLHFPSPSTRRDEDFLCATRSLAIFEESESAALSATGLYSSETLAAADRSSAILALATSDPDRFLALAARLTPILEDILIQHYLLGRSYAQIGRVLFSANPANTQFKWTRLGNHCAVRALAALLSVDGDTSRLTPHTPEHEAWMAAMAWGATAPRAISVAIRYPRSLGDFVIHPNGQLKELFAPSWTVLSPCAGKTLAPYDRDEA